MSTLWQVSVDRAACVGSGMCVGTAAEHFTIEADHRSRALRGEVEPDDAVLDAANCCPMEAITVVDLATDRRLAPGDDDESA